MQFAALANDLTPLAAYWRISLPTLFIQGRQTRSVSARITDMLASHLRGASRVVIEQAGHMLPLTHAELVNAAIGGHIMEYTGSAQGTYDSRRASAA